MAREIWLVFFDGLHSPFRNMAVDELLISEAKRRETVILRTYGWDRPAVSFGYSQSSQVVPREGVTIVRRPTGGGIVFHGSDLTYTLAIPIGHAVCRLNRMKSYEIIHKTVLHALESLGTEAFLEPETGVKTDRAHLQCFRSPSPRDVMGRNGKKLAGAAQRRTRDGILHQGSISLDAVPERDRTLLIHALCEAFRKDFDLEFKPFQEDADFRKKAGELAGNKYADNQWNNYNFQPENEL